MYEILIKKSQHLFSLSRSLEEHSGDPYWDVCCLDILFSGMEKSDGRCSDKT